MLKKTLISLVLSLGLTTVVVANEELKKDMGKLSHALGGVQSGFLTSDKAATLKAIATLKKESMIVLGDKEKITKLLPVDLRYKASIAINSADIIVKNVDKIEKILKDKNMRMINRQMRSQKAFSEIQNQCFRCHNLVRDWQ